MDWRHLQNRYSREIKTRIFRIVLTFTGTAFALAALVNALNKRPAVNIWLPLVAACFHALPFLSRFFLSHSRYTGLIQAAWTRRLYMAGLAWVYLPLAWLTSPGSHSAMPFYALAFIVIMVCLALDPRDYLFPLSSLAITLLLVLYEPLRPLQFAPYAAPGERSLDLALHFLVATSIIVVALHMINRYFSHENRRIYTLSITDPHTGLYNRRYFYEVLSHYSPRSFCLVLMDLNNFKRINDTWGHPAGDSVLLSFSRILQSSCRREDLAIRYGGDEFILLLHDTTLTQARTLERRIRRDFRELEERYSREELSIAFGYATHLEGSIEEVIQKADEHLYKRKPKKESQEAGRT
ncbi:GGDEF domain-containing protein [Alkalispirochaeta alkalica]|uniref:GGDEF domain-containing protein n=1 Tax=Alkalispirochaeta alkalica TaxID=46356 RepID=UPI00035C7E9C|nr:GGDEF domain-containing protein [Alkalispirochaeta alkalica]